jgi:hypothetical protein
LQVCFATTGRLSAACGAVATGCTLGIGAAGEAAGAAPGFGQRASIAPVVNSVCEDSSASTGVLTMCLAIPPATVTKATEQATIKTCSLRIFAPEHEYHIARNIRRNG